MDWNSVNVNNIALNKKTDMDKAVKFYTEILGLKLISRSDVSSNDYAVLQAPG